MSDADADDSKKRPSPVRTKPAGSSRRLDRNSGRWKSPDFNGALPQAMLKAILRKEMKFN
jgi:hypothetical protein